MVFYLSAPRSELGIGLGVGGIYQGRFAGDLPTYIKTNISLGTVVEVQQVALSFAISETFLPDHKAGSVTEEDL